MAAVEIPDRPFFKASEVCALAKVQPFVLRSWEREFPKLGESTPNGGRVYRKVDIELVLSIKRLLLEEGLTLGAARRKLGAEEAPEASVEHLPLEDLLGQQARERITAVKSDLRAILASLSSDVVEGRNGPAGTTAAAAPEAAAALSPAGRGAPARPGKGGAPRKRRRASP